MKKLFAVCGALLAVGTVSSWAQDSSVNSGQSRTEADAQGPIRKSPYDSNLNISLHGGVMSPDTATIDNDRDLAGGLLLNWNVLSAGPRHDRNALAIGVHTGAIWSNLSSDELGDADNLNDDANIFMAPANLFVGYRLLPRLMLSAHGGANLYYQPDQKLNLGDSIIGTNDADFTAHPNAGLELGWGLTPALSLMVRTDVTFTENQDPFVGTVGLGMAL